MVKSTLGFFAPRAIFPLSGDSKMTAADLKQANSWFRLSYLYLNWMVRAEYKYERERSSPNNGCGGERDLSLLVYCVRLLSATLKLEEGLTKSQPAGWISMVPILNFKQRGNSCRRVSERERADAVTKCCRSWIAIALQSIHMTIVYSDIGIHS